MSNAAESVMHVSEPKKTLSCSALTLPKRTEKCGLLT
jgi:hypothetical protein